MKINKYFLCTLLIIGSPLATTTVVAQVGTCVGDQVNVYCSECEQAELDSNQCTTRLETTPEARWCCCEADYPLAQCTNLFDSIFGGGNKCDEASSSQSRSMMKTARNFRDNVLQKQELGRKYSRLYYESTKSLTGLLLKNPTLLSNTAKLLKRNQELMNNLADGQKVKVGKKQMQQVYTLLKQYVEAAGEKSDLGVAVSDLYRDLTNEKVLSQFGVIVTE